MARRARCRLAGGRPAGQRRGAAAAWPDRAIRQRTLGRRRVRLDRDAGSYRCGPCRHGGCLARRVFLPARGCVRAAFRVRRRLGCEPRLARGAEAPAGKGGRFPGAALLGACLLGMGCEGYRRFHAHCRGCASGRHSRPHRRTVPGDARCERQPDPGGICAPYVRAAGEQSRSRAQDLHRSRRRRAARELRQQHQCRARHRRLGRRKAWRPHRPLEFARKQDQ